VTAKLCEMARASPAVSSKTPSGLLSGIGLAPVYIRGMVADRSPKHEERRALRRGSKRAETETTPDELEASTIFERVERALAEIESRTERLKHQYGL